MLKKSKIGKVDVIIYFVMFVIGLVTLYPFWYVLLQSVLPSSKTLFGFSGMVFPTEITLEGYQLVFEDQRIIRSLFNATFLVVCIVGYQIMLSSMLAYGLKHKDLPGQKFIMFIVIVPMFFGGGLIPTYLLIKNLGLINSYWALILPAYATTYNVLIMKSFFESGSTVSLEEAAKIDGASEVRIFFSIILPLSKPILATISLFIAVSTWNNWFGPMLYLRDMEKQPIAFVLRSIIVQGDLEEMAQRGGEVAGLLIKKNIKMATVIVGIIPILMVYPFLQKHFAKGVMIGAVKS